MISLLWPTRSVWRVSCIFLFCHYFTVFGMFVGVNSKKDSLLFDSFPGLKCQRFWLVARQLKVSKVSAKKSWSRVQKMYTMWSQNVKLFLQVSADPLFCLVAQLLLQSKPICPPFLHPYYQYRIKTTKSFPFPFNQNSAWATLHCKPRHSTRF